MKDRQRREQQGRRGEALAAWYLRLTGWRILGQRIKTPRGEVDIIARRGKTVAFIEVKWRKTSAELDFAIDNFRLRRVAAAAEALESRYVRPGDVTRVDVLLLTPRHWPRRIANAWQPGA